MEATWESVYERNSVERIKRDTPPLAIRDELPALIAEGYERMAEENIVRLQWWGLYHDKPKIGTFMLRVKIPSGILTPAKLRTIGEMLNTTEETAKNTVFRATQKLRGVLQEMR